MKILIPLVAFGLCVSLAWADDTPTATQIAIAGGILTGKAHLCKVDDPRKRLSNAIGSLIPVIRRSEAEGDQALMAYVFALNETLKHPLAPGDSCQAIARQYWETVKLIESSLK
jgi:hypothetical protein